MSNKMDKFSKPPLTAEIKAALANRERAYIAASRRKDRSDEARLESALRGSEIHKELTGKSLIVTREIVMNGGEYVEEDPAFDRLLARRQQGPQSPTSLSSDGVLNRWPSQKNQVQFVNGFLPPIMNGSQTQSFASKNIETGPESSQNDEEPNLSDQKFQDSSNSGSKLQYIVEQFQQNPSGAMFATNTSASISNSMAPIDQLWFTSNDDFTFSNHNDMDSFINQSEYQDGQHHHENNQRYDAQDFSVWHNDDEYILLDSESKQI